MKKGWFFGDSFTYGQGCRPGYEYFDKYPELRASIWTDYVSEKLNLEQVNKGIPGNSTSYILKQVIENLSNFNKGDFIFLSDTLPTRLVYPTRDTKIIKPLVTDIIVWPERNKNAQHALDRFLGTEEERRTVVEFVHQSIMKHFDQWVDYYMNQLIDIQKYLLTTGVHVYIWSHKQWIAPSPYECIIQATNREIDDGHWSWAGHKKFSNYILDRVYKKEYQEKPVLI